MNYSMKTVVSLGALALLGTALSLSVLAQQPSEPAAGKPVAAKHFEIKSITVFSFP